VETKHETENSAGENVTVDTPAVTPHNESIIDSLTDSMPEVQEHVIESHNAREETKHAQWSELRDRDGNGFDPAVHKTNKEGEPTLSPKGLLIKKPGRKPGSGASAGSVVGVKKEPESPTTPPETVQARATGKMAANMLITLGIVAGGEEWHPAKDEATGLDEKLLLETAFADYFEATGRTDIPPGMALTIAIGSYALPRFTLPKTKKRIGGVVGWFKQKWIDRKLRKHHLKTVRMSEEGE
jgi:hypothetical protein